MDTQQGISFTEFSYQLLQAYDFYTLHRDYGCCIQIGGSDQWGNILAGIEMINRLHDLDSQQHSSVQTQREKGFGLTTPLLTTTSGEKFGKTAGNAVWLDEQLTSVFDFYQVRGLNFTIRCPPLKSSISSSS
jgi:tyrosyl-tRNA synthetase